MEKIIYPLSRYITYFAITATALMMFLTTADVIMRRVFDQPILGSYEISKVLLVILIFSGVAYVQTFKGHVSVDSVTRFYPRTLKIIKSGLADLLSMLIVGLISWQSVLYGIEMFRQGETFVLLNMVVSPFIFIVAFGSFILFLVILVQFIYTLAGAEER